MATQAANIQLLGGMLTMAPANGANGLLSQNIQGAAPSSDAFYSLWVGLTQGQPIDSTLVNIERQTVGADVTADGSLLPPMLPSDLLKKIENLNQFDSTTNPEVFDDVISQLKESLQHLLSTMESQESLVAATPEQLTLSASTGVNGVSEDVSLTDEQLLAYLQLMQQQLSQQQTVDQSKIANSTVENSLTTLSMLSQYLEQKLSVNSDAIGPPAVSLTDSEQKIAEERLNQLWIQLENASKLRAEVVSQLSSEQQALLQKSSELQAERTSASADGLVFLNADEGVNQDILDQKALSQEPLNKETTAQLIEQQNILNGQTQQNLGMPEQVVSSPLAPLSPSSQAKTDKSADRLSESRGPFIPTAPLSASPVNELTPAERLAASEMMLDGGRRVLTDAISQAISQRASAEDTVSENIRRQEIASAATTLIADNSKMVQSPATLAPSPLTQANNSQDALMQKMLNPQWSKALGERAVMMAQQGPRLAEVRLDPPELGSLRIKVQVHANDQVSLTFNAPNASVREVLEQSLPRLREMFAEQGMNLADASVSDQSNEKNSEQAQSRYVSRGDATGGEDFGEIPANRLEMRKLGIIDYYA